MSAKRPLHLMLGGNVYLNPLKEEALLRGRLGHHEITVTRAVLVQFVERYRSGLREDEAALLKAWGEGRDFGWILRVFDNVELIEPAPS